MLSHWRIVLVALCALAASLGCSKDDAAIRVLQQLTAGLVEDVNENNDELSELEERLTTCQANVAQAKRQAVVIKTKDVAHDVPVLIGEPSIQSLEAYQATLDRTLTKQEAELDELREEERRCGEELATLTRPVRRRAVAKRSAPAQEKPATAPAQATTTPPAKEAEPEAQNGKGAEVEFDRSSGKFKLGGNWK